MQVSADIRRGIVFFGFDEPPKYLGTGFLLAYRNTAWLVTARHVARGLKGAPFWIRASARSWHPLFRLGRPNSRDPLSLDVPESAWDDHPDPDVDVSVMLLHLTGPGIDYCPEAALLTRARRRNFGLEVGNFAYTVGLFVPLPGETGAMAVVHTGFIARLPEDDGPIKTEVGNCEAYLERLTEPSDLVQADQRGGDFGER